mmetsp:Transcript_114/g.211  ORF Transcript_114/g.211 Transcript_114/m.211 type:complete len:422 (+) Transcript_114:1270-2535(+)
MSGVAELRCHDHARRLSKALGQHDSVDLDAAGLHAAGLGEFRQQVLPPLGERLVHVLHLVEALNLVFGLFQFDVRLLDRHELLALIVREFLDAGLVQVVGEQQHLDILLLEDLQVGKLQKRVHGLTAEVVDRVLLFRHVVEVGVERDFLALRLGGGEAQQLGDLGAVGVVLVAAHLQVLAELLVEDVVVRFAVLLLLLFLLLLAFLLLIIVLIVLGVLRHLLQKLEHLADKLLGDHLHDLVLLQLFARDVERQVVGIDDAAHEVEVAGQQFLELLGDEHAAHVELHLGLLGPVVVQHVHGGLLRHEQDGLEVDLALRVEVRVGKGLHVVLGDSFVELSVLLVSNLVLRPQPDRLLGVHLIPLVDGGLLLFLGLLLLFFLLLVVVLGLSLVLVLVFILFIILVVLCFDLLLDLDVDGVLDKL